MVFISVKVSTGASGLKILDTNATPSPSKPVF
jgi:hypothetical protein